MFISVIEISPLTCITKKTFRNIVLAALPTCLSLPPFTASNPNINQLHKNALLSHPSSWYTHSRGASSSLFNHLFPNPLDSDL